VATKAFYISFLVATRIRDLLNYRDSGIRKINANKILARAQRENFIAR